MEWIVNFDMPPQPPGGLALGGFDGTAAVQSAGAVNMIFFMYAILPIVMGVVMAVLVYLLKVEKANKEWDAQHS